VYSLPAFFNVALLMVLVVFIYALVGMAFFVEVPLGEGPYGLYNKSANFQSFSISVLTLFRMMTGESWNGIMHDVMSYDGYFFAWVYFVSFQMIGVYCMFNLLLAIVLDQFTDVTRLDFYLITPTVVAEFSEAWTILDPDFKQCIETHQLSELLCNLQPPLGFKGIDIDPHVVDSFIEKQVQVPDEEGKVHFVETLVALSRCTYGHTEIERIKDDGLRLVARALGDRFPSILEFEVGEDDLRQIVKLQRLFRAQLDWINAEKERYGMEGYKKRLKARHKAVRAWKEMNEQLAAAKEEKDLEHEAYIMVQPGAPSPELLEKLHSILPSVFLRYDLDNSGSINGARELQQLTINLCFSLGIPIVVDTLQLHLDQLGDWQGVNWSMDDFKAWFGASVMLEMCGIVVTPEDLQLPCRPSHVACSQLYEGRAAEGSERLTTDAVE